MSNDIEIRKKRKKVSRNGWMANLQRDVLGREPKFTGYCPFFWMTWVCCILYPFVKTGRGFVYLLDTIGEMWDTYFPAKPIAPPKSQARVYPNEKPKEVRYPRPSNYDIVHLYNSYERNGKQLNDKLIYNWGVDWDAVRWAKQNKDSLDAAYAKAKAAIEREEAERQRIKERQALIAARKEKIVNNLAKLVKPVLAILAIGVAYLAFKLVVLIAGVVTLKMIINILITLAITATVLGTLYVIGLLLKATFELFMDHVAPRIGRAFEKLDNLNIEVDFEVPNFGIIDAISNFFGRIRAFFRELWKFVKDTVVMTYKEECPLVEWTDDESGPIEANPAYKSRKKTKVKA